MISSKRKRDVESDEEDEPAYGKQILPVANLPDTFDQEPMDGLQYLFLVRRDARQLPDVIRAPNPFEQPDIVVEEKTLGPESGLQELPHVPLDDWRELLEYRFQNFRKNLNQPTIHVGPKFDAPQRLMPDKKDREMWWAFLSGKPELEWIPRKKPKKQKTRLQMIQNSRRGMRAWDEEEDESPPHEIRHLNDEGEVEDALRVDPAESLPSPIHTPLPTDFSDPVQENHPSHVEAPGHIPREPTTRVLKLIDERTALHLLMYFTYWINVHLQASDSDLHTITEGHARWIFALLSRIDDYITADDMNLLRNLGRVCTRLLKKIKEDEISPAEPRRRSPNAMSETSCWMILSVIVEVWKQRDLWDDATQMLLKLQAS